jgi:hypothetical protein
MAVVVATADVAKRVPSQSVFNKIETRRAAERPWWDIAH